MATSDHDRKLAKRAVRQAEKQLASSEGGQADLPPDAIEEAIFYVQEAYDNLYEGGLGYNPRTIAPTLAEGAVISFVRDRITGVDPSVDQQYQQAKRRWAQAAAAKYHKRQIDRDR